MLAFALLTTVFFTENTASKKEKSEVVEVMLRIYTFENFKTKKLNLTEDEFENLREEFRKAWLYGEFDINHLIDKYMPLPRNGFVKKCFGLSKLNYKIGKQGFGIAFFCPIIIFGGGITFPPIGVAWPALLWFAENALGGAGYPNMGYILGGPCFGIALPFIGLELTGFHEGKPVFAIYGFTFFTCAWGEGVWSVP